MQFHCFYPQKQYQHSKYTVYHTVFLNKNSGIAYCFFIVKTQCTQIYFDRHMIGLGLSWICKCFWLRLICCFQTRVIDKVFVWCLWDSNVQLGANDQVQVNTKNKIETSFLYAFWTFQIAVSFRIQLENTCTDTTMEFIQQNEL